MTKELLRTKIISDTATIEWSALLGLFAKGLVIWVKPKVDLVDIAIACHDDDAQSINHWMDKKDIQIMQDDIAKKWLDQDQLVWATVVKPWVLVQAKN